METYLGEAERVKLVLSREIETVGLAGLDVVGGLGAHLDGVVDLLVVGGSDDGEVLLANKGRSEAVSLVAEAELVAGDRRLLDVVAGLTTNEEAVGASDRVDDGVNVAVGEAVVDESASVDDGVLEDEVELLGGAVGLAWIPKVYEVDFHASVGEIGELNFGVEEGGGGPGLGDGDAWFAIS